MLEILPNTLFSGVFSICVFPCEDHQIGTLDRSTIIINHIWEYFFGKEAVSTDLLKKDRDLAKVQYSSNTILHSTPVEKPADIFLVDFVSHTNMFVLQASILVIISCRS